MQQNLCHTNLAPPKFDTRPPTAYNSGFSKITVHSVHHSFQTTSVFRIPFFSNTTVKKSCTFQNYKPYTFSKLLEMAEEHGIENANRFRKQDLVFAIVRQMMKQGESFTCSGTLEILPDGFGFLRSADTSYLAGPDDIYVSPTQIRRFNLHTGDTIEGSVRVPKDNERYFALVRLDSINGDHPEVCKHKILFENLTPLFPLNSSNSSATLS